MNPISHICQDIKLFKNTLKAKERKWKTVTFLILVIFLTNFGNISLGSGRFRNLYAHRYLLKIYTL